MNNTPLRVLLLLALAGCASGRQPVFSETWAAGAGAWRAVDAAPIVVSSDPDCPAFQRETVAGSGGRVLTRAAIPVQAGGAYCLAAWIRVETVPQVGSGAPFLGLQDALPDGTPSGVEVWPIGVPGYTSGVPTQTDDGVGTDDAWHWYRAPLDVDAGARAVVLKDENFIGVGAADFGPMQLFEGDCPSPPASTCALAE